MAISKAELAKARDISDRRIALLVSKGEDVRNTPAWRDAQHERRAINFSEPSRKSSTASVAERDGHTRVLIEWYAAPNENKRDPRGGWMPALRVDGKRRGDTYGQGYDRETAEAMAESMARGEAERYTGDWSVTVRKGG